MNLNFLENVKLLNEMTEFVNAPNIEIYDILLDDSKYYSVFPIEYFSKENNCTINVLSYYVDKYYSDVSDDIEVDTSQYFTSVDSVENEENHMKIQLDMG